MARSGLLLALAASLLLAVAPVPARAALAPWTGSVNLYASEAFSTHRTFLWCTAANVQMMRNMVHGESDRRRTSQSASFVTSLRSAVKSLRRTNRPVGLLVARAWEGRIVAIQVSAA